MAKIGLLHWLEEECRLLEERLRRNLTLEETDAVAASIVADVFGEDDRFITLSEVDYFFKVLWGELLVESSRSIAGTHHFTLEEVGLLRKYH
jgi:hypothetical protein